MKARHASMLGGAAFLIIGAQVAFSGSPKTLAGDDPPAKYTVERTAEGQLTTTETIVIDAPVTAVWRSYTTSEGYASWAAPFAKVDLRPGGVIRTSYDADKGLEGAHVNTLRIVNYVPNRLLTLQADVGPNWPEVLRKDAANLYNVILFDSLDAHRTRVTSYGLGYTDSPELREMMVFFERANQQLYRKLIESLK